MKESKQRTEKVKIKIKNKTIEVTECKTAFSKFTGLMFKRKSKPLLFVFDRPTRTAIHSFFVFFPFVAVWLDDKNKIIERRFIRPFRLYIKPKRQFYKLLEIPINKKYQKKVLTIVDAKV